MNEYKYSHVIKNIENIREDGKVNIYHEHILGKRCNIYGWMKPGYTGEIMVEPFWCYTDTKWFRTTTIDGIETRPDGTIVMRTQNTIYTFVPNPGGADDDLPRQCGDNAD